MSVIVYKDGILAADSLWTSSGLKGLVHHRQPKIALTHDGQGMIGFCGSLGWEPTIKRLWEKMKDPMDAIGSRVFIQALGDQDWGALLIYGNTVMEAGEANPAHLVRDPVAIGSGADLALGAMAMGASARIAAYVATKHSSTCGGKIVWLKRKETIKSGRKASRKRSSS